MGNQSNTVSISNPVPFKKRKNEALKKNDMENNSLNSGFVCSTHPTPHTPLPSHTELRMLLNNSSSCLHFPSADIVGVSPPMAWISCFRKLF